MESARSKTTHSSRSCANAASLSVCPINVRTGVVPSIEAHPIRALFDRGVLVTVNTDDPAMFGTSLTEEYALLHGKLGFSRSEVQMLVTNAIRASWLSNDAKGALLGTFERDPAWR